jgi:hypothetical protein
MALWKARDAEIAKMLAELEAGLKRLPTIEECTALAEERDIALPVCLLDARPYDLRHTFASVGAGGGLSLPIIGKLLGHTQARTTQRYAHLADDPAEGGHQDNRRRDQRGGKTVGRASDDQGLIACFRPRPGTFIYIRPSTLLALLFEKQNGLAFAASIG